MTTMIDRVKDALRAALEKQAKESFGLESKYNYKDQSIKMDGWFFIDNLARAAMEAMREPTAEMANRGEYVNSQHLNYYAPIGQKMYRPPAIAVYKGMIDAALKEADPE